MPYLTMIVFILIALLLNTVGCRRDKKPGKPEPEPDIKEQKGTAAKGKYLTRENIKNRLREIKRNEAPQPVMGAMCYMTAYPPMREDYVCPVCGEKTLYAKGESRRLADRVPDDKTEWLLMIHLDEMRRIMTQINMENISIDESQFCRHCSPDVKQPRVALVIRYTDSEETHRVEDISIEDCRMLRDFLKGLDVFHTDNEAQIPLKGKLERLEILFGVEVK